MNKVIRGIVLGVWMIIAMYSANAAEYSGADDIPATTSLLFTPSTVAITITPYANGEYEDTERTLYFLMDRSDVDFRQVSREQFANLTEGEHRRERTRTRYVVPRDYEVTYSGDCADLGYRYDSGPPNLMGRRTIRFDSVSFEVRMLCRSSIAETILRGTDLWIATYEAGGHGEYGADGVLIASNAGAPLSRLDVGDCPVENLVKDPWSSDIWIVTRSTADRRFRGKDCEVSVLEVP